MFISPEIPLSLWPFTRLHSGVSCVLLLKLPLFTLPLVSLVLPATRPWQINGPAKWTNTSCSSPCLRRATTHSPTQGHSCHSHSPVPLKEKSSIHIGITYHQPMELPDTGNLDWKEAIIRCLESLRSRAGIPSAAADSSLERPPVPALSKDTPKSLLVPSSSPLSPLVTSSSPSSPLVPSSSALPERPPESQLYPSAPRESALPKRPRESALPERPESQRFPSALESQHYWTWRCHWSLLRPS